MENSAVTTSSQIEDLEHLLVRISDQYSVLIRKIMNIAGYSEIQAKRGLLEVLRFLSLVSESETTLTPSQRVDEIWHEFILFTLLYQHITETYFGRFIHHFPGDNANSNKTQYSETLADYKEQFGDPDPFFWPISSDMIIPTDGNCGGCKT